MVDLICCSGFFAPEVSGGADKATHLLWPSTCVKTQDTLIPLVWSNIQSALKPNCASTGLTVFTRFPLPVYMELNCLFSLSFTTSGCTFLNSEIALLKASIAWSAFHSLSSC